MCCRTQGAHGLGLEGEGEGEGEGSTTNQMKEMILTTLTQMMT